jgi:O-antigen ligase
MNPVQNTMLRLAQAALCLFIFSIPMEKAVEIPGLGTISKLFGLLAFGVGALAITLRRQVRLPAAYHWVAGLFIAWSALTYFWTFSPENTQERITTYTQLLLIVILIWQLCPALRDLHWQLGAYVAGTIVPAISTVQRFLSGQQTYYGRYATAGFDPNDLAITLAIGLPLSYYLSLVTKSRWLRCACLLQMTISLMIILLTASRTGMVASVVALSLILTTAGHLSPAARRGLAMLALVLLGAAITLVPAASFARLATLGSEVSEGNLNSRTVIWTFGWRAFMDVPLQGVGAGAYPEALAPAMGRERNFTPVAHNSFLSILVETGLVGLALFLASLAVLMVGAWKLPSPARQLWLTTLAVWAVGVMALTWEQRKPTWVLFALVAAHAGAVDRRCGINQEHAVADQLVPWPSSSAIGGLT